MTDLGTNTNAPKTQKRKVNKTKFRSFKETIELLKSINEIITQEEL